MPIDFPNTPTNNQVYTSGSRSWTYNSSLSSWEGGLNTVTGNLVSQNSDAVNITGGTITRLTNLTSTALSSVNLTSANLTTTTLNAVNTIISGNLAVDTNSLFVDSVNNRVGIGTTSPNSMLTVVGNVSATGSITTNSATIPTINGNTSFSNNTEVLGQLTAPNQTYSGASSVITPQTLITLLERTSIGLYNGSTANGGANTQFITYGSAGFGGSGVVAGATSIRFSYFFNKATLANGGIYNVSGGGYPFTFALSHKCCFGLYLPIDTTARDVEIRAAYGNNTANSTTNTSVGSPNSLSRLGVMGSAVGWGIKITKHPTNNTYLCRLYTRPFDWNSNNNITSCSNTTPIVVTTPTTHNLQTGDRVEITGIAGNTAANGEWIITRLTNTTFSLDGSSGNGLHITNATNANPIVITTAIAHGLTTGNSVTIAGVLGNTNANTTATVTVLSPTTFSIPVAGNAAFSNTYALCKTTNTGIELTPRTYYRMAFVWNAATQTVSFHLDDPSSTAQLSLSTFPTANTYSLSYQIGHQFNVGFASVTDTTLFLGIQASSPTIYQI